MSLTVCKPNEFAASGESPPTPAPLPDHLVDALAQILADALHEDIKQYPNLFDIPPLMEPTVVSRRGSARRSERRPRREAAEAAGAVPEASVARNGTERSAT